MATEIIKVPCSSYGEMTVDMTWKRREKEYADRGHIISRYHGPFAHAWGWLVGNLWDIATGKKRDIVVYQWDTSHRQSFWEDEYVEEGRR